ncbi:Helicase_conserved domain containing protein [Hexamita inflata]|uniref:Helicase conserved domain containing protein n=1 Tax=Hexamita inflata TaxID=28002 RepID=A0AA86NJ59_9EUKA|nr:Helicase conserved domain containing protein [Hexamita inflata]
MKLLTNEYKIKKFSYLPSVYGLNKLTFAKDTSDFVKIVEQKEYFTSIVNEINKRRQNNKGIPVLVFFETSAKLDVFYKSREFKIIDNYQQVKLLTEKISPVEKEGVVRQAVTQNTVTLITREFGRGTDFVCYDKIIDGQGGVHVIQTFFSDQLSEEKQIKGRTSRQGNNGSYSLVLLDQELEKYGLVTRDIETMKARSELYSTIDPKRQLSQLYIVVIYSSCYILYHFLETTQTNDNETFKSETQVLAHRVSDEQVIYVRSVKTQQLTYK